MCCRAIFHHIKGINCQFNSKKNVCAFRIRLGVFKTQVAKKIGFIADLDKLESLIYEFCHALYCAIVPKCATKAREFQKGHTAQPHFDSVMDLEAILAEDSDPDDQPSSTVQEVDVNTVDGEKINPFSSDIS
jgi:hypothetical protein